MSMSLSSSTPKIDNRSPLLPFWLEGLPPVVHTAKWGASALQDTPRPHHALVVCLSGSSGRHGRGGCTTRRPALSAPTNVVLVAAARIPPAKGGALTTARPLHKREPQAGEAIVLSCLAVRFPIPRGFHTHAPVQEFTRPHSPTAAGAVPYLACLSHCPASGRVNRP